MKVPMLKVGTLDSLMGLSDKLGKVDVIVGAIAKKLGRTFYEVNKEADEDQIGDSSLIKVDNKTPEEYVEKFNWNRSRYPVKDDLNKLASRILEESHEKDSMLKKKMAEFSDIKTSLAALHRKESGSLLVKSLAPYVSGQNAQFIIDKEWITTLLLVIPKEKEQLFLEEYEQLEDMAAARKQAMAEAGEEEEEQEEQEQEESKKPKVDCSNVVPGSAKRLDGDGDGEFVLYRVLVLKKGVDLIKNLCRERRYTVRPFEYDPQEEKRAAAEKGRLKRAKKKAWTYLVLFCKTAYADVFAAWVHIKVMRTFCESVLRFGLPVDFQATLLEPAPGKDQRLRAALKDLYKTLPNAGLAELAEGEQDLSGLGADFYPYVYFALKTSG